nr:MAG TPA: zinc finger domain protein [Crassvirales sp.]
MNCNYYMCINLFIKLSKSSIKSISSRSIPTNHCRSNLHITKCNYCGFRTFFITNIIGFKSKL